MEMTSQRWAYTTAYLRGLFGREDAFMACVMPRAVAAGLPDIAVSSDVGRLFMMLAGMAAEGRPGGRDPLAIEVGTLAGYSGTWIARGLGPTGKLITIEPEPRHADFALTTFAGAGVADRVTILREPGISALTRLAKELAPGSVDFVLLDAIKTEYLDYLKLLRPLIRVGGLLLADNALGSDSWWIDDAPGSNESRDAMDRFNRTVALDDGFVSSIVPLRQGVLVSRRVG